MNYALIGCGRISTNHMKAAVNNKLNIVAVCDILPEAMENLLAKHGLEKDASIKRYTDYKQMLASLARLATLEEEYRVLPGHGEDSLLSYEKRSNPYMQGA